MKTKILVFPGFLIFFIDNYNSLQNDHTTKKYLNILIHFDNLRNIIKVLQAFFLTLLSVFQTIRSTALVVREAMSFE